MVEAEKTQSRRHGARGAAGRTCLPVVLLALAVFAAAGKLPAQAAAGEPDGNGAQPASTSAADAATPEATKPHDDSFIIGNDDMLAINVWKEPDVSRTVPVRSDGKISLPLVGEVTAAGQTPLQLEKEISDRLLHYMTDPEVTVIVQQINSEKFNILGQVAKPGTYPLTSTTTIVDAIAIAGGFKDFAKKKSVYVLRQNGGGEARIGFNYQDFIKGKNTDQNIPLKPHDTIIVP